MDLQLFIEQHTKHSDIIYEPWSSVYLNYRLQNLVASSPKTQALYHTVTCEALSYMHEENLKRKFLA